MEPFVVANPTRPTAGFVAFATFAETAAPAPLSADFSAKDPAWKQNKNKNENRRFHSVTRPMPRRNKLARTLLSF